MIKKAVYIETAPAKINLFLEIVNKRDDDYHEIASLFQAVTLLDDITFEIQVECGESKNLDFEVLIDSNNDEVRKLSVDNLVVRALEVYFSSLSSSILSQISKVTLNVFIDKNIPLSAGLAGGSANAAATLRAFNKFFHENFAFAYSESELAQLGVKVGSDVPFCVRSTKEPQLYAQGRGEEFMDISDSEYKEYLDFDYDRYSKVVIVKPGFGVSTREAYRFFGLRKEENSLNPIEPGFFNRFEDLIYEEYKDLWRLKEQLIESGCDYAMLSGSGSTVLGFIDKDREDLDDIFDVIKNKCRGYETVELCDFYKAN